VMVFHDESAAREMERRMRAVDAELERSNRELDDFAAIASHDLQEPLRKIQAFGDRLADHSSTTLDEEARDYLRRMTDAAGRMQTLISDLLEYSQVTIRPEPPQPVDLAKLSPKCFPTSTRASGRVMGALSSVGFPPCRQVPSRCVSCSRT